MDAIYIDNNAVVELRSLTNSITGLADTGATVTVTITDSAGNSVAGETWPVSLNHVSDGTYRGTLSSSMVLKPDSFYIAVIDATGSGGEVGEWNCKVIAQDRPCS